MLGKSMKILEVDKRSPMLSSSLTVAVAVNGSKKSNCALKWALERFSDEGKVMFKLLHVRARITTVPTPMGNYIPISQVRDDVATAYKKEMEWKTSKMLLPHKQLCSEKKVEAEIVQIEADDVPVAISNEVSKAQISMLVIGASSGSSFTRKLRGQRISSKISECTPTFCTVYVVSKGKLSSVRPYTSEADGSTKYESSDTISCTDSDFTYDTSSQTDQGSAALHSYTPCSSLNVQPMQAHSNVNKNNLVRKILSNACLSEGTSVNFEEEEDQISSSSCPDIQFSGSRISSFGSRISSFRTLQTDWQSMNSDQVSISGAPTDSSSENQVDISIEIERLRTELRHARGMYAMAQKETIDASRRLKKLSEYRMDEVTKLMEISFREEKARELANLEKEKHEVAEREAELVRESAEREASQKRYVELRIKYDAKEIEKLEKALMSQDLHYKKFTWEEIVSATSSFSDDFRIGMGAYGTVYKCNLRHIKVAVKVLHAKEAYRIKQFQRELEIMSKIRHPHMLLLVGACSDHSCIVYEYMENGSLEDRLLQKNNTVPIPWFIRYRIAWEVATALSFLHNSKPRSIVHRDLKPANILLDHNFVSKIGDVGLSTLLPSVDSSDPVLCHDSRLAGTLSYIDPEYQRSGLLSPKSDVYAFGMVILQLLTAKPALALAHTVETALNNGGFLEILDQSAGNWPIKETLELAILGLRCIELKQCERPDLSTEVLPVLQSLKRMADAVPNVQLGAPSHFICPILKDMMEDPCVAADGYTYDRKAIEMWFKENENSPITNLPMSDKSLVPNYILMSAIIEWKSRRN
ncbi:hypothetical protein Sjap_004472 [Stephania japonica]|uniref:RING-type E3 ubiquitin transferase n=1 Tax=Stephania japonica TaxID=461633 RepID=A0AAP0K3C3_9MAGN